MAVLKVLAVIALLAVASYASELEMSDEKPRRKSNKKMVAAKTWPRHSMMPKKDVVIVPKGDPRARPPTTPAVTPAAPSTFVLKAGAPGAGCTAIKGRCIATSACTGANHIQKGLCPGNTYCCVANAATPTPAPTPAPASDFGAKFVAAANTVCASYHRAGTVYSQPRRQFGMSVKYSDCSSFVTSVLEQAGYGNLFGGRNCAQTQCMRNVISRKGGGYHKNAALGDIVMWASGSTGHVGIITKVCTPTTFQLTAMGNHGCGPYPTASTCMTWQQMTAYGEGGAAGFLGYWTPH